MIPRAPDGVRRLQEQTIRRFSDAVGCIDSSARQTISEDVRDAFGQLLGRVSVHVVPNGRVARVDVFLHAAPSHVRGLLTSLVLEELRGQQFKGAWQEHASLCRFTVPKEQRLLLETEAPERDAAPDAERTVESLTLDQMERLEERLEGRTKRKGKGRR